MESDDEIESHSWKGVPGSVILINVLGETVLVAEAATRLMIRQCLRTSDTQHVGVCLYGIEDTSATFGINSVQEILPLSTPTLDDYKKIVDMNGSSYTKTKNLKLSEALWHANKMFSSCKKQLSSKNVIILSKLGIPPIMSDQKPTIKRVEDLIDSNIDIKIINISEKDYVIDPFYAKFINYASQGEETERKPLWDVNEIFKLIYQQSSRHLAVARLPFELGNGVSIGVGVYMLLKKPTQPHHKKVNLNPETNVIISCAAKIMKEKVDNEMDVDENEDSKPKQVPLLRSELLYYQEYGGERIEFSDNEMKTMKNPFGPPIMKLLGFKPATMLCKEKWFLKTCYFLYPNEAMIEGSTVAFKAMYQACVNMSVVAVCVLCTRINSRPNIVALSPCSFPLGLDAECGFDVIPIPFVEHLRDIPSFEDEENINISVANKTVMKEILEKLQFDYRPDMFQNPKLQSEYIAIETKALHEENTIPFIDTTKPDSTKFRTIKDDLFEELFGPFGSEALKRTKAGSSAGPIEKKSKGDIIDETAVADHIANNTVYKFTRSQILEILKLKPLKLPALTGLKKHELVDLVYQHFK